MSGYRVWQERSVSLGDWRIRIGGPVHRPFWGVERETFGNGTILRISFWPDLTGVYVVWWKESPMAEPAPTQPKDRE